jgi:4-nitrophenyl phosphatase
MQVRYMIIDMDGVLWKGDAPMPGLTSFFEILATHEIGFILATNNATRTPQQYTEKLASFGVEVKAEQILNSAEATAGYLQQKYPAGTAVFVVGEDGLCQALADHGFVVVQDQEAEDRLPAPPGLVVAALDKTITYQKLATASLLVGGGATFIGTNPDPSFPSERGELPGAGAIQAVITTTTGVKPTIIGKPGRAMFDEALRRLGAKPEDTVMVGDRLATDIAGGKAAELTTILVLSGISQMEDLEGSSVQPDFIFEDIQELAKALPEL